MREIFYFTLDRINFKKSMFFSKVCMFYVLYFNVDLLEIWVQFFFINCIKVFDKLKFLKMK